VTEVRKIWTGVTAGVITFFVVLVGNVLLTPNNIGLAFTAGGFFGAVIGLIVGFGVIELCNALQRAQKTDTKNREKIAAEVKAEYERMMREEERKSRG
jgi:hypothetical protein